MAKGQNNNNNSPQVVIDLKKQIESMETRIKSLEGKVENLEGRLVVSERVSEQLTIELDRLDQYHRRSNIVVRDVFLPENETNESITKNVHKMISKDLESPSLVTSIDKLHRFGKIKEKNGKKSQNVIIRFKSHYARYSVYNARKHKEKK